MDRELNNLHKFVGCPARHFWTGGTPIPQEPSRIVSYLILIPLLYP